jgi:hypothetical protein
MVGGQFHAEGFGYGDGEMVKFTLFDSGRVNATDAPVRLVGGKTRKDGRLQVGTVLVKVGSLQPHHPPFYEFRTYLVFHLYYLIQRGKYYPGRYILYLLHNILNALCICSHREKKSSRNVSLALTSSLLSLYPYV